MTIYFICGNLGVGASYFFGVYLWRSWRYLRRGKHVILLPIEGSWDRCHWWIQVLCHLNIGFKINLIWDWRVFCICFLYLWNCHVISDIILKNGCVYNVYTLFHILQSVWFNLKTPCGKWLMKMCHWFRSLILENVFERNFFTLILD